MLLLLLVGSGEKTVAGDETRWFRCEVHWYATVNEHGDTDGSYSHVRVKSYEVKKHTPKGAWLIYGFRDGKGKFVLRDMQHRARAFAAPTKEQAVRDFMLRKKYHIGRLQLQIIRAEKEMAKVKAVCGAWPDLNLDS